MKTSQSYFSTLEKVCGCIRELKRDVDNILKAFFRDEGRIDYVKLTEHLSRLKYVEWFKAYRPEVYSEVITNIEQQIIHHTEELLQSVMAINLDLDNYNKLQNVSKIISEINAMKPIEKIIKSISQLIQEVNTWFEIITSNVFIVIKDTFSLEKYKQQDYPTYDINKLEKAFYYLDACKKIPILSKNDLISNDLEEFVRQFYLYIQTEIENYFESIKNYTNESKEITVKKARLLSNRLQEIDELKTQHSRVFSCLSNQKVIDKWKRDLTDYKFELSDEMEKLRIIQRADVLTNKLFITQALSKLDEFLEGEKYIDIYYKYQNIFFIQNTDVSKKVIDAIKADDYERVASEMVLLQSSSEVGQHFYKQVRQALNYGLKNLIDTTIHLAITLGNEIEIKDIRFIVEHLKRMETAKQFISTHLDQPILIQIDETLKEVERLIEEKMKVFLERVNANFHANNFYEADKKVESIAVVRTLLGKYCTSNVAGEIEKLRETQRTVVLEDSVKKYSELNISDYIWNPPTDIFEKFDEVKNTNPIYEQALKSIQKVIVAKFREELKLATLEKPPNPDNQHIRNFESAVKYLPEKVKSPLEIELKYCKENIHRIILNIEDDLNNEISSANLSNIKNVIQKYQNLPGMQSYINKGQELARKQFQEIKSKINENIQKNDIREALYYVKQLYDGDIELGEFIVEIRKLCSEVRS